MKLIDQLLQLISSFKIQPTQADRIKANGECPPVVKTAPAEIPAKSEHVTIRLAYAGEDTKYLRVNVAGKAYKVAKSRIQYVRHGDDVMVTMTRKYAASRPELVEQ